MGNPERSVNAWILLAEDEPPDTGYESPDSCYQSLIQHGVYNHLDMLNICFVETVPAGNDTWTIRLQQADHPDGRTNQDYMDFLIRDARKVNPDIKLLVTLDFSTPDALSRIFAAPRDQWRARANAFADNVLDYLQRYGLDGFDIDWEAPLSEGTTTEQMALVLTALREVFDQQPRSYFLTLSPAVADHLDGATVNRTVDFLNLQLYSGFTEPEDFIRAGISKNLLAYGAKFETADEGMPFQTAQQAYKEYVEGGYRVITQWRLNSDDFRFEQAQQMILYQLVHGVAAAFDDTPIVEVAGNPRLSQMIIRSGNVLDAIQAVNTGMFKGKQVKYTMPRHGGHGGAEHVITIPEDDVVVEVSGFTGDWFGWQCVLQLTVTTRNGRVFGPFGTMEYASSRTPFKYTAPEGEAIIAFSGRTIEVPVAGGGRTWIIAELEASCARAF